MPGEDLQPLIELMKLIQIGRVVLLVISLLVLIGVVKGIQNLGSKLQASFPKYRLITLQIITMITFFLYIAGGGGLFYIILKPPKELLLGIGASVAVAIGFSLKDLVASFMAGIVLLFDRPFHVGDRVTFNDTYGKIISIGLRAVRLQTLDDNLVTIPNSKFISDVVSSGNAGALDMMVVIDFHVALDADISKAKDLLYEIVVTSRFVFLKKPVKVVVGEVEVAERLAIQLKVKAYVFDVNYEKDFQTDIVSRTSQVFSEHKIQRPVIQNKYNDC